MALITSDPAASLIDVLSPCVTFNNNPGSTKSYDFVRAHMEATATVDFVPEKKEITVDYDEGTSRRLKLHDGSYIQLQKLADNWDPMDRDSALVALNEARAKNEILTGLLYVQPESRNLHGLLNTVDTPLNELKEEDLCPGAATLDSINQGFR